MIFTYDYNKKYEIAVYLNIVWKSVEIPAWSQIEFPIRRETKILNTDTALEIMWRERNILSFRWNIVYYDAVFVLCIYIWDLSLGYTY